MKALKYTLTFFVVALVVASCKNETSPETKTVEINQGQVQQKVLNPDANYIAAKFEIEGMMCAMGCAKVIEKNMAQMDGVKLVEVDFESKSAKVEYDEEMVNKELLIANLKKTGESYEMTIWNGEELKASKEIIEE